MSISYYKNQLITNLADSTKINYKAYYHNNILFGADAETGDTPTDYSEQYLTLIAKTNGTFVFSGSSTTNVISYSTDDGSTWSSPTQVITVNVNSGDTVLWKGEMTPTNNGVGTYSASTASFDAQGNIMSLLYGDSFKNQTSLSGKDYTFYYLFSQTKLVNAANVELPATTLANYCYSHMFRGCTSLTTAPQLLATTLANYCYNHMFRGCTSLTTAPQLLATTLADYCYSNMFRGCTSLTQAPSILPATTLTNGCYNSMFDNCISLTIAPQLPATTLANNCYQYMFYGCTSLTTAPVLSASTLASYCYAYMFKGCTNLNSITMLATTIYSDSYLSNWVQDVASTGTFVKAATMTSLPSGNNGIPVGWTVQNA